MAKRLAHPFFVPSGITLLLASVDSDSPSAEGSATVSSALGAAHSDVTVGIAVGAGVSTAVETTRVPFVVAPARPPRPPRPRSARTRPRPSIPPRPRVPRAEAAVVSVEALGASLGLGRVRSVVFFLTSPH